MTKKQLLSIISLWFFTIGIFGLGFSWLVVSGDCENIGQKISRLMDNQDDFVVSFGVFGRNAKLPAFKDVVEQRQAFIKENIESYKEVCRTKKYKRNLISILKQYEIYLYLKQAVFKERQNFDWHQELFPKEFVFSRK